MENTIIGDESDVEDLPEDLDPALRPITLLARVAARNLQRQQDLVVKNSYSDTIPSSAVSSTPVSFASNDSVADIYTYPSPAQHSTTTNSGYSPSLTLQKPNEAYYPPLVQSSSVFTSATATSTTTPSQSQSPPSEAVYEPRNDRIPESNAMNEDYDDHSSIVYEGPSESVVNNGRRASFSGTSIIASRRRSIQSDNGTVVPPPQPWPHNNRRRMSLSTIDEKGHKVHKCPKPYCSKVYKNSNGLKYHLERGQCEADDSDAEADMPDEIKRAVRPYGCATCDKRYKNLNGLKYHAKVAGHEISEDSKRNNRTHR